MEKKIPPPTEFIVAREDINDKGLLYLCKLLREFTGIYEQYVIHTFGDLGYYRVLNSSYHVDLSGQAKKGDRIRLEAKATIYPGRLLDMSIKAIKAGRKEQLIAMGRFVFELEKIGNQLVAASPAMELCYEPA